MPGTSVKRVTQSADEAVQVINKARKYKQSLEVTKNGDIALKKATVMNTVMLWLGKIFSSGVRNPFNTEDTVKAALAAKMRIDIEAASAHTHEQLRTSFDDIERVSSLNALCTEWIKIKNTVRLCNMRKADDLLLFNAQQAGIKMLDRASASNPSDPAPTAPLIADPAMEYLKDHAAGSVAKLDSNQALSASPGTVQGDSATALSSSEPVHAKAAQETQSPSSRTVVTHRDNLTVYYKIQNWIKDINQALPTSMVFKGEPGEIITAILTLPDTEHRKLYATLENTKLGPEPKNEIRPRFITDDIGEDEPHFEETFDEKSRIAHQTLLDCGRAEFQLTDADGFCQIFDVHADASEVSEGIIGFGRNARGLSLETGSRLINQEALGALYVPLLTRFSTKTGGLFRFNKTDHAEPRILSGTANSRTPKLSMNLFKWTWLPDGSAEFEMVQREKIHDLLLHEVMIPVNRDTRWQGDISDDNFGYEFRSKIRIAAEDMRKGNLKNVTVIEPLSMTFRIAPSAIDAINGRDEN